MIDTELHLVDRDEFENLDFAGVHLDSSSTLIIVKCHAFVVFLLKIHGCLA